MRKKICALVCIGLMSFGAFAQPDVDVFMIARNLGLKQVANYDSIRVFGFALDLMVQPNVPGPTIIANEGDSVHIDVWNVSQGAPHTIHLHGLDVDQYNDGVPHLSWDIPHMDHGYYNFKAPQAGTYLYHCHVASTIHVQAGMYGLIIIRPPDGSNTTWDGGYPFDKEFSYFASEIDTFWHHDDVLEHEHDTAFEIHQIEIPVFNPQYFLINGYSDQLLVEKGEEMVTSMEAVNYIRLSNLGYCGIRVILPSGLNSEIVDSDGRPLPTSETADTVYVYPGERYGVLCEATTEFMDSIQFEYIDMNTLVVKNTQYIPVTVSGTYGVEENANSSDLLTVAPNPFGENATVTINLKNDAKVELILIDTKGSVVHIVPVMNMIRGTHRYQLDRLVQAAGVYTIQLSVDEEVITRKIVKQ